MDIPVANFTIATDVPQSDITIPTANPNSSESIATASPVSNITIATPNPDFHYVPGEKVVMTKQLPFIPNYGTFNPNTYLQGMSDYEIMAKVVQFYNESAQAYNQVYAYQDVIVTSLTTTENYFNNWGKNLNNDQKAAFAALQSYFNNWGTVFNNDQKSAFNHLQIYFNHWGTELSNDTKTAFNQLQAFVNEFFANLDITGEIEAIMLRLFSEGRFDYIISASTKEAAETWLNDHLYTGFAIDTTLTIKGAASDSYTVGKNLETLLTKLHSYKKTTPPVSETDYEHIKQTDITRDEASATGTAAGDIGISGAMFSINANGGDVITVDFNNYPTLGWRSQTNPIPSPSAVKGPTAYTSYAIKYYACNTELSGNYERLDRHAFSMPENAVLVHTREYDSVSELDSVNKIYAVNLADDEYLPVSDTFIWPDNCNTLVIRCEYKPLCAYVTNYGYTWRYGSLAHYWIDFSYRNTVVNNSWLLFGSDESGTIIWNRYNNMFEYPRASITVSTPASINHDAVGLGSFVLADEKVTRNGADVTTEFVNIVEKNWRDKLEQPSVYYFASGDPYNKVLVYEFDSITFNTLLGTAIIDYICKTDTYNYHLKLTRPQFDFMAVTVDVYSERNALYNEVVKRHILEYDSGTLMLKEGDVTYDYSALKSLLLDQQSFVIALINGRVYYPESISDTEIVLSATYANNTNRGYVTSYVAKLRSTSATLTLVEYESEKEANKTDSLSPADFNRADKYPSMKAVGELFYYFAPFTRDSDGHLYGYTKTGTYIYGADANAILLNRCAMVNSTMANAPRVFDRPSGRWYTCSSTYSENNNVISATFENIEYNPKSIVYHYLTVSANTNIEASRTYNF